MLKRGRSHITDKQVKRCSQIGGEFGKNFDKMVSESLGTTVSFTYRKNPQKYQRDLEVFVAEFQKADLFDVKPGRCHKAFPAFTAHTPLKDPEKLGRHLRKLSHDMDLWRRAARTRQPPRGARR